MTQVGRLLLVSLLVFFGVVGHAAEEPLEIPDSIGLAHDRACGIFGKDIKCWGTQDRDLKSPANLNLKAPKELVVGGNSDHLCVIDQGQLVCYGYSYYYGSGKWGLMQPPRKQVRNPRKLSGNGNTVCALDDDGAKCWSWLGSSAGAGIEESAPDVLENATELAVGENFACAIANKKIQCWGDRDTIPQFPDDIVNPRRLSASLRNVCAMTDGGPRCWGTYESSGNVYKSFEVKIPGILKRATDVLVGGNRVCARTATGLRCFGVRGGLEMAIVGTVPNMRGMYMGRHNVCATGDRGVQCFGLGVFGINNVPFGTKELKKITHGENFGCGLGNGRVTCWGTTTYKTHNTNLDIPHGPLDIPSLLNPTNIFSNYYSTCAITDYGPVCWGQKTYKMDGIRNKILHLVMGDAHACAITTAGVECSGTWNIYGELNVPAGLKDIVDFKLAFGESCAIRKTGESVCWGKAGAGEPSKPVTSRPQPYPYRFTK